jgi:hypothetical protein
MHSAVLVVFVFENLKSQLSDRGDLTYLSMSPDYAQRCQRFYERGLQSQRRFASMLHMNSPEALSFLVLLKVSEAGKSSVATFAKRGTLHRVRPVPANVATTTNS